MVDLSQMIVPQGNAAIEAALLSIGPGEWVLYAYAGTHALSYGSVAEDTRHRRVVETIIAKLEAEERIMRFLVRLEGRRFACIAHGVQPGTRRRLEEVLDKVPIDFRSEVT